MLRTLFLLFAIYFIYRFVFEFLIPMFRATSKMQQNIRSMQEDIKQQQQKQQAAQASQPQKKEEPVKHDYIDFEEVK